MVAPDASSDGPQLLATLGSPPFVGLNIVVDSENAYVASYEAGPVYRVALDGSGVTKLDMPSANVLAIDATRVYTLSGDFGGAQRTAPNGLVVACAKTGCNGGYTPLAAGQTGAFDVAVDDTSVYWAGPAPIGVMKMPLAGGMPTPLVPGFSADVIAVAGGRVFFDGAPGSGNGPGGLLSVPVSGGPVSTVFAPADPAVSVGPLATDSQYVYFGVDDGSIGKAPIAGGPATLLAKGLMGIGGLEIAVDANNVYFPQLDGIYAVPLSGGTASRVVPVPDCYGIAVDARALYWTTASGAVMRAVKK
jgi:hypothetical protein